MTRRKLIITVLACLLLGAIVNVAVAWCGARYARWPFFGLSARHDITKWPIEVPSRSSAKPWVAGSRSRLWTITRMGWGNEAFFIDFYSFGWPARSLQTETWHNYEIRSGRRLVDHPEPNVWNEGLRVDWGLKVLPLRPIWPGFAINTIIYAAVLWLVFCAWPGFVRRRVRRGRGQCLHCGYDLRGQPPEAGASRKCPECGQMRR